MNSKVNKTLHLISHLKWIFVLWIIAMIIYAFTADSQQLVQLVGSVIFAAGLMMGFSSLSDNNRLTNKELIKLANPKYVKRVYKLLIIMLVSLIVISMIFFSAGFIFPKGDSNSTAFTRLGLDCLVMLLGFLCLIKQFSDQSEYANEKFNK